MQKLKVKAQKIFNAYIRRRDSRDGFFTCISCGKNKPVEQMHAGHYIPQKKSSLLRYNESNVNGECNYCNLFDEFHLINYRKNLIDKIGEDMVKYLEENQNAIKKWSRAEIEEIILTYKNKDDEKPVLIRDFDF